MSTCANMHLCTHTLISDIIKTITNCVKGIKAGVMNPGRPGNASQVPTVNLVIQACYCQAKGTTGVNTQV